VDERVDSEAGIMTAFGITCGLCDHAPAVVYAESRLRICLSGVGDTER
jgi:hypothetical protein